MLNRAQSSSHRHPEESISRRHVGEQIKRFYQLRGLGRVLLEHQLGDVSLEGVLAVLHQLSEAVSILETRGLELQNVDRVHFCHVFLHRLQLCSVQLECLPRQVRRLSDKLVNLALFLRFEYLSNVPSFGRDDAPRH